MSKPHSAAHVALEKVSVRYRVPEERVLSLKEYIFRRLKNDLDYFDIWAVRDVSLDVRPAEILGIVGQNGAGKTTLLRVISRVIHPTEGRVRLAGRIFPLLELGAGFNYELTGRENVLLNGMILGYSRREMESRLDRIVAFAGLERFVDVPLRLYSTGMIARLGFSVATDARPEILVVDEVFAVGDEAFRQKSIARMRRFREEGSTILFVSHALDVTEDLCDRVLWLENGRTRALGPARSVMTAYGAHVNNLPAAELACGVESP